MYGVSYMYTFPFHEESINTSALRLSNFSQGQGRRELQVRPTVKSFRVTLLVSVMNMCDFLERENGIQAGLQRASIYLYNNRPVTVTVMGDLFRSRTAYS